MKILSREKKITFDLSVIFLLIGLSLFLPWLVSKGDEITDLAFWAAIDAFLLFSIAAIYALGGFTKDLLRGPRNEARETVGKRIFWLIVATTFVWGILVLLSVGTYKCICDGKTAGIWESTENIMRSLDSNQYLFLAENWYTYDTNPATDVSIVFLPGFPVLVKLVNLLIRNVFLSGTFVSITCFAFATGVLYLLVSLDRGKKAAIWSALFFVTLPGVFFFVAPMSESLFLVTTLACVYFIRTKKWTVAAIFGCYSAFTRSMGVLIMVVFVYELALEFWNGEHSKKRVCEYGLKLLNILIIPVGLIAYFVINKIVTGNAFEFMAVQKKHWGQSLGFFYNTVHYMANNFISYIKANSLDTAIALWGAGSFAIFSLLLLFAFRGKKLRNSYLIYSLVYFAFSMGTTWLLSAPRYAIGLFTLPMLLADDAENNTKTILTFSRLILLGFVYGAMFVYRWQVW